MALKKQLGARKRSDTPPAERVASRSPLEGGANFGTDTCPMGRDRRTELSTTPRTGVGKRRECPSGTASQYTNPRKALTVWKVIRLPSCAVLARSSPDRLSTCRSSPSITMLA